MIDVDRLRWLKLVMDYLGGAEDEPPPGLPLTLSSWTWGVWWAALTLVIALFSWQTSRFIYIDF
jgi:hypothetical protein